MIQDSNGIAGGDSKRTVDRVSLVEYALVHGGCGGATNVDTDESDDEYDESDDEYDDSDAPPV